MQCTDEQKIEAYAQAINGLRALEPDWDKRATRLTQASRSDLEAWAENVLDAGTLDDVFDLSKPRVNLTRFHGVLSPNSKLREHVVPQKPVAGQESPTPKVYYPLSPVMNSYFDTVQSFLYKHLHLVFLRSVQ